MTKCLRHFRALTKKNAIVWYRTPFCALFEFLVPVILFTALCIIRIHIPLTQVDQEGIMNKKLPVYPPVAYYQGYWSNSTSNNDLTNDHMRSMVTYANYTGDKQDGPASEYDMGYDRTGPQFFFPFHCLRSFDYQRGDKRHSNLIGIVGKQSNYTDSTA